MQEMQDTQFQSLAWEDPLQEYMATHSNIFAWEIPRKEEPDGLQSLGTTAYDIAKSQRWLNTHIENPTKKTVLPNLTLAKWNPFYISVLKVAW